VPVSAAVSLRAPVAAPALGRSVERQARAVVLDGLERISLAVIEVAPDSSGQAASLVAPSRFVEQIAPAVLPGPLVDLTPTTFVRYVVFRRVPKKALLGDTVHVIVERALDTRERCLSSTLSLAAHRWRRSRNGRSTRWFGGRRRNADTRTTDR